jgi:hypothetical protein
MMGVSLGDWGNEVMNEIMDDIIYSDPVNRNNVQMQIDHVHQDSK